VPEPIDRPALSEPQPETHSELPEAARRALRAASVNTTRRMAEAIHIMTTLRVIEKSYPAITMWGSWIRYEENGSSM